MPLPQYGTPGAVAFDFIVRETTTIEARGVGRVPSNTVVAVPEGYMLFVKDRSSTAKKKGLLVTAGFIDQDYCGDNNEILLQFYNPSDAPVIVERGDRVAQGVFLAVLKPEWEEVEAMNQADRGSFGSTG